MRYNKRYARKLGAECISKINTNSADADFTTLLHELLLAKRRKISNMEISTDFVDVMNILNSNSNAYTNIVCIIGEAPDQA